MDVAEGPRQAPTAARAGTTTVNAKSASVPFLEVPEALDGTYPGDVGFDPGASPLPVGPRHDD